MWVPSVNMNWDDEPNIHSLRGRYRSLHQPQQPFVDVKDSLSVRLSNDFQLFSPITVQDAVLHELAQDARMQMLYKIFS